MAVQTDISKADRYSRLAAEASQRFKEIREGKWRTSRRSYRNNSVAVLEHKSKQLIIHHF